MVTDNLNHYPGEPGELTQVNIKIVTEVLLASKSLVCIINDLLDLTNGGKTLVTDEVFSLQQT